MATYAEILFGRVVLNNRLASHRQVAECLRELRGRTLAEVMVAKGLLTPDQARQAQRAQALAQFIRAEKIFARILVDRRLVDAKTVRRAFNVQAQRQYKTRLAALLIEQRLLDPSQLESIVDEQLVRLAEETARIEEQGLEGALKDSNRSEGFEADAPEDLGSVRMKNAVGPQGFIDSPRATLPMRKAAKLDDEPPRKRTMIMDSAAYSATLSEPDSTTESSEDGLIGKLVASRYKVLEKVGVGGMGTVYRAEHCLMEKVVALKVLNPELVSSQRSLERFRQEIRAASRFQHRHVIQIYDAGEGEGGIFYMAMEFAEGEDLEAVLAREGALPLDRVLSFFRQTLEAVGEAHKKKIVHRDLKSGNLMVTHDKHGTPMIKIMDFGIAKIALEEGGGGGEGGLYRTQEGIVTGTPQYMSPEQASGEPVDHRSDLYSLGVILFEMLTGQLPFRSDTPMGFLGKHIVEPPPRPSAVRPELGIPPVLESIALRLLEKSPDARYQTAAEVIADMDARCTPDGLQASTSGSMVQAPLAMTLPARSVPQGLDVGGSGHHGAIGATIELPSGIHGLDTSAKPAKKRQGLVIALALGFLLLLSLSTSVAVYLSQQTSSVEQEVLDRAETLLAEGRFSEVKALLEPLEGAPEAAALLEKAKQAESERQVDEARAQVTYADELVAGFRRGAAGREAATKALGLYRDAQRWIDDEELVQKIQALEERLGPVAATSPAPRPARTPVPIPSPAGSQPTPAVSPAETPPPTPASTPGGGQTQLYAASHALLEGRLEEAARLLKEAGEGLPSDHPELVRLQSYLASEELAGEGRRAVRAGRTKEGVELLRRAAKGHPRAAARRELEAEAKEAEVAAQESGALSAAREAILDLDPAAARKAIASAPDAEGIGPLEEALKALERFAREWREARTGLAKLRQDPAGDPAEATRLAQLLESVAPNLEAFPEGELKVALNAALTKERAGAKALVTELRERRDANKSEELRRFEASLAAYREQKAEVGTAKAAEARLGAAQDLQYAGAYRRREASPEDRSYVDKEVLRWRGRVKVWRELEVPGAAMIRIEGGSWTPPGGKPQKLPAVFYASSHELTCEAWDLYVRAKKRKRPRDWPRAGRLREPVRTITLSEAKAYCRWLNQDRTRVEFVVPDEFMWERAARGPQGTPFPWGEDYEKWREGYAAVRLSALRPVGAFKRDLNEFGLFDTVGNVAELTRSREAGKFVVRGGSFLSARGESGAAARTLVVSGDERANHIGLRLFAVEKE